MPQGKRAPDKDMAGMLSRNLREFIGAGKKWHTKKAFADVIGTSGAQITNYLNGSLPQADVLYEMSKATGKSMEWLLTGREGGGGNSKCDDKDTRLGKKVRVILESGTKYAGALKENIDAFEEAIREKDKSRQELAELEKRMRREFTQSLKYEIAKAKREAIEKTQEIWEDKCFVERTGTDADDGSQK